MDRAVAECWEPLGVFGSGIQVQSGPAWRSPCGSSACTFTFLNVVLSSQTQVRSFTVDLVAGFSPIAVGRTLILLWT
ncbi:hypothetical protein AB5L52_18715 [Streptomyces sp. CG4]|uniref:hypothetical protein n=1 Tax=Streptomyces sp. CG4 TaxID=408783 RepID=UPI0034E1C29F